MAGEAIPLRNPNSVGFVPVKSAATLASEQKEAEESERKARQEKSNPLVDGLSAYIDKCWYQAKEGKRNIEDAMMESLRQRNGIYEADVKEAIRQMGGSEIYVLLTSTKCRAAEAWINEVLRPVTEYPFSIDPTPIADLPPNITQSVQAEVFQLSQQIFAKAQMMGQQFPSQELVQELREYAKTRMDESMKAVQEEAKARADRMTLKITDQMAEGGWFDAFWAVVSDFVTLKAGVLKGPVIRKKKVQKWVQDEKTGKYVVSMEEDFIPCFERVSPFDIYPAPDSRGVDDGYIIERHRVTRQSLLELIDVKGYSNEKIRAAIRDYGQGGSISREPIDSEREEIEFHGELDAEEQGEKIQALEFWGSVQGKLLKEWGVEEEIDEEMEYEVNAWKVGQYVIRAVLNPDKLGRKPYSIDSYERIAGSFWGKGIPELMKDIQGVCNATARALVNNAGIASGPQVEVNTERCDDYEDIYPWKIWESDNRQLSESPAVRFTQPTMVVDQLLKVFEHFSTLSEDQTGIPRYAYGNMNVGAAGETSSGLHTLMSQASRGIKESIAHLDTMIASTVKRTYDYNMMYDPDESIKGDCKVVARGSSSLVAQEQRIVRTREFLQTTNNPVDNQIVGYGGRAKLLREAAKGLGLEASDIIPDGKELNELIQKLEAQAAQQQALQMKAAMERGQTPDKNPQSLDASGQPAGGTDFNFQQNPQGQTAGLRAVPTT